MQILEDLLGGYWEKPLSKWEGRRDRVLDLIGKATPGTFQPSLQIDGTSAKLLEARSGRWSYEQDRRDKRTMSPMRFLSCRNDSAHAEQRTNQGDLKLRSVGIHRLYAVMIDE